MVAITWYWSKNSLQHFQANMPKHQHQQVYKKVAGYSIYSTDSQLAYSYIQQHPVYSQQQGFIPHLPFIPCGCIPRSQIEDVNKSNFARNTKMQRFVNQNNNSRECFLKYLLRHLYSE